LEKGETKKLKLIAHKYREPRPEFINKLRSLNRDISDVEIVNFIGSDLRNNCQVRIEAGSSIPRSNAAKQEMLKEIMSMPVFAPMLNDPVNQQEFLERMGIKGFNAAYETDFKRASWENEMLDNGSFQNIQIMPLENHNIHLELHMNRMKEPSFMTMPDDVKTGYQMHVDAHNQILQQQAQQAAVQQAMAQGNMPAKMAPTNMQTTQGQGIDLSGV